MNKLVALLFLVLLVGCTPSSPPVFKTGDLVIAENRTLEDDLPVGIILRIEASQGNWRYFIATPDNVAFFDEKDIKKVGHFSWSEFKRKYCDIKVK